MGSDARACLEGQSIPALWLKLGGYIVFRCLSNPADERSSRHERIIVAVEPSYSEIKSFLYGGSWVELAREVGRASPADIIGRVVW